MPAEPPRGKARKRLGALTDGVAVDRDGTAMHPRKRRESDPAAAVEPEGLRETMHLLRSPRNARRLLVALSRARAESRPASENERD